MNELDQVEREIAGYKNQVALGELLVRLSSNKDFKALILDGFLRDNAVRLVHLKSHPAQQKPESQIAILREIDSIGALSGYFRAIHQQAEISKESLINAEDTRAYMLREAQGVE